MSHQNNQNKPEDRMLQRGILLALVSISLSLEVIAAGSVGITPEDAAAIKKATSDLKIHNDNLTAGRLAAPKKN